MEECQAHVVELEELVAHLAIGRDDAPSASMIIHEVAQPVTAATNFLAVAEKLLSEQDPGAKGRGLVAIRHAQDCLTRTGQVMRSVRDAADSTPFDACPQDLAGIVDDVMQLFQIEPAFTPAINIHPAASWVSGDGVRLGQVVSNLVRNAMEATEGQSVRILRVSAKMIDADSVEVRIEDNGPGIPAEMKGRLFSPFASTKAEGAGVGLSICRAIVELHHGQIWAEALPVGSAFCFTVPSSRPASVDRGQRLKS
jgi:two-component system, LuxR family, sensor kinase FixL